MRKSLLTGKTTAVRTHADLRRNQSIFEPNRTQTQPLGSTSQMNKAELVESVSKSLGAASRAEAERAVNAVIDAIKTGIRKDKSVQLVGFGTFRVAERKARMGINPKTGE